MTARRFFIRLTIALAVCLNVAGLAAEEQADDPASIVLDILKSGDQDMAAVAIGMVKEMPGPEVTKALSAELPNLSATSQVQLISALGDRGDKIALPAISETVKSKDQAVRIAAIKAISQLGDASSVTLLAKTAAESSGQEQKAAQESLARLRGDKVDETILAEIPKAEPKTKVELINSVGKRNIYPGVKTLLTSARDEDRKVRSESIKTLKIICEPNDLPDLVNLLIESKSSSNRTEAEKTIATVAHKIEDKNLQAKAVLDVLPKVTDLKNRSSLLSVLGRIGDSTALPVLRKELGSQDANVRTAVIRALAQWPTGEPVNDLFEVAKNSQNKLHKILALRGFVALLQLPDNRSDQETVSMYVEAMKLAPNDMEKRRVLSGLGNTPSLDAMNMAMDYMSDATLFAEAEVAVMNIAQSIYNKHPQEAKEALNKIIQNTKNDSTRNQAKEILENANKKPDTEEQ